MPLAIGDSAPDFAMQSTDGPVRLADFSGRNLILYFYPRDNTTGCTREAIEFSELLPEFEALNCTVLGVSTDSLKKHENFIAKQNLKIPLASDPEHEVIEAYGSWVPKKLYGREYTGIDRSTFLIDGKGRIAALWRKVKVAGHAAQVLQAVRGL